MKLIIWLASALLSYVGWYAGEPLGFGWAFFFSSVGALVGVYAGWKIARHFGIH